MVTKRLTVPLALALSLALPLFAATEKTAWTLVGYNNLGMHCMDSDYSVFSILPPYNTIHAQLTNPQGLLIRDPAALGITVTYQAVADPTGSINTSSTGKTDFWSYVTTLFGASVPVDQGLAGNPMPGTANTPRPMTWDTTQNWWIALGIPITAYDDARKKNPYPLFHLVARDSNGAILATTDIVLPVSDEMDCRACHASGAGPAARPPLGWAWNKNSELDYRLNILLKHDDSYAAGSTYKNAAVAAGYSTAGLYPTVATFGKAVLCANCHASEALGTGGQPGVPSLTSSVHAVHSSVIDPTNGQSLDSSTNRTACYRCHPGAATKCLRGAMGQAVAADGTMAMQCQGCHGSMSQVGVGTRTGWLDEPNCQNCHTGTAISNNGQIRYSSAFDVSGQRRQAIDQTFATNPNVPLAPYSLYRFSHGHGTEACESCHGSTHAEYPSSHANDNAQSTNIQGHAGMLVECDSCHVSQPATTNGGPHGMHPVGQTWVNNHPDQTPNPSVCRPCHGIDYRASVLSRAKADRQFSTPFGLKTFFRGSQVSCFACHNGPNDENANPNRRPVATNTTASTSANNSVTTTLVATDPELRPLTYRIVSQPAHGTVALSVNHAIYFPEQDYFGTDAYTWAAWDGMIDSNLATVTVNVAASTCQLTCSATVAASGVVGASTLFQGAANFPGCVGAPTFDWDFGDGQPHALSQTASHTYFSRDTFAWTMTAKVDHATCVQTNTIRITGPTPTGVPSYLTELRVTSANQGQDALLTWDAANCPATDYELLYGYGSGLSVWTITGSRCAIGTSGSYNWSGVPNPASDTSRLLWFLVVGTNGGTVEGSWGHTSSGVERHGTLPSNACGVTTKDLTASCAAP